MKKDVFRGRDRAGINDCLLFIGQRGGSKQFVLCAEVRPPRLMLCVHIAFSCKGCGVLVRARCEVCLP